MADTHVVNELALAQAETRGGALFIYTSSEQPCGVEIFTCTLVAALRADGTGTGYELLPVSGHWRDLPSLTRRTMRADQIVFSLPLVAWKRLLVLPLILLLIALVTRRRIAVVLHEWSALHWLRRLALMPFVMLSDTILVLSPYIRSQIAGDRLLRRAARKCGLIPHPPTIQRPKGHTISDAIRRVEEAAQGYDIVIGYFGAIYPGKGPEALLDVCDHLRSRGVRALILYAGSFNRSLDNFEQTFRARISKMGLDRQVIITGYIKTPDELFALFERIGVFLLLYPEGLTARRSSAIACLQSNRPVVVSAPQSPDEFQHHVGFNQLIDTGILRFVPQTAGIAEIADAVLAAAHREAPASPAIDCDAWWSAATAATRAALAAPQA